MSAKNPYAKLRDEQLVELIATTLKAAQELSREAERRGEQISDAIVRFERAKDIKIPDVLAEVRKLSGLIYSADLSSKVRAPFEFNASTEMEHGDEGQVYESWSVVLKVGGTSFRAGETDDRESMAGDLDGDSIRALAPVLASIKQDHVEATAEAVDNNEELTNEMDETLDSILDALEALKNCAIEYARLTYAAGVDITITPYVDLPGPRQGQASRPADPVFAMSPP